jgi:hypothetical protein
MEDEGNGFMQWEHGVTPKDLLWGQSLAVDRMIEELMRNADLPKNEEVFMNLLRMGVIDPKDGKIDNWIWSMRHSSALAARLWTMYISERQRVGVTIFDAV